MAMTNREKSDLLRELYDKHPPDIARAIYNERINSPEAATTPTTAATTPAEEVQKPDALSLKDKFRAYDHFKHLLLVYKEPDSALAVEFTQRKLLATEAHAILRQRQIAREFAPHLEAAQRHSRWGIPNDR